MPDNATTRMLRPLRVFNDTHFFNGDVPAGQVYIDYWAAHSVVPARWAVIRVGYKTDPDAHWSDRGHKSFGLTHEPGRTFAQDKAAALQAAQRWAEERYGIVAWKRTPFGGWGEETFVDARLAELKQRARQAQADTTQ